VQINIALGVLESIGCKGVASKPIKPMLKLADARKVMPDTKTPKNLGLYEHSSSQG
jgi:hypothetical protein